MKVLSKYKLWVGAALCLGVMGLIVGAIRTKHVSGAPTGAPMDVEVVPVEQKSVPIYGEWIGTLDGFSNADVRAQVTGYLQRQAYQEGAFVKKGQLLFKLTPAVSSSVRPSRRATGTSQGSAGECGGGAGANGTRRESLHAVGEGTSCQSTGFG